MVKCPTCGKEVERPNKEWNLGKVHVRQYECCGKKFREYAKIGQGSMRCHFMGLLDWFRRRRARL